jgi:hypothetical protein
MKSIVIAVLLLLSLGSVCQAARLDTSFAFSSIETPNFSIHYHQGLESLARKAALIAESAHDSLCAEFLWYPEEKTQLVLIDDSDFANGLTTTLPYNSIVIQVVPPALDSTIGVYDDWLRVLITHEYTHILNLDVDRGYSRALRGIFGKTLPGAEPFTQLMFIATAPPNIFLPRWWHEGMATWAETEYSGQGRGNATYYDMVFRMAVAGNALPSVDRANGDQPQWPDGHLRYLYGYRLQRFVAEHYGNRSLGLLNQLHAGRAPYLINGAPQQLFNGKDYLDLYRDMLDEMRQEQQMKLAELSLLPFTPTTTLSDQGERLTNPRYSPDGSRIAYTRRDPRDHTTTVIMERASRRILGQFRRNTSDGTLCWAPDGSTIYFTQAEINRGFNVYQDLYAYDIARDQVSRLTSGERLGSVDISPDGRRFAAVVSGRGSQQLALLERGAAGDTFRLTLLTQYPEGRVSSPRWSPDGQSIAYALKENAERSSLHLCRPDSGNDSTLFSTDDSVDYPVWSRDGSSVYYVCDLTGVFNLFAFDLKEHKSYQVSHLMGGALHPDLAPDGATLAFASYDARGFSIAEISARRDGWSTLFGPSLPVTRWIAAQTGAPGAAAPGAALPGAAAAHATNQPLKALPAAAPYRALPTLLPHFWLPRVSGDGSGSAVLGALTAGADVLGYHSYALSAEYSFGRERGYFDLNYRNDYFYPTLSLSAHSQPFLYGDLLQRGDYWELNQGFTLEASYPINVLESRYQLSAGYQFQDQSALSTLDGSGRFHGVTVFQGRRDNLFAGVSFDNVLRYPFSVSSEEGRRISLLYRRYDRALGSEQDYSELSARYQEFLRLPTESQRHQVLYLRLAGAVSDSNQKFGQQAFQTGGIPSDLNPYSLRGYPSRSQTGKYLATGTLEYRTPLFYPMHGAGTLPFFYEKVHGALFLDAGEVWDDSRRFSTDRLQVGAGVEARLDLTVGYWVKVTPALGFARGLRAGGENQVYLTVYVDL